MFVRWIGPHVTQNHVSGIAEGITVPSAIPRQLSCLLFVQAQACLHCHHVPEKDRENPFIHVNKGIRSHQPF